MATTEQIGAKALRQKRHQRVKQVAEALGLPLKDLARETERALVRLVAERIAEKWQEQSKGEMGLLFADGDVGEIEARTAALKAQLGGKKPE